MEEKFDNTYALKDFVEVHNLSNSHSIIQFNSIVSITTALNEIRDMKIKTWISFADFDSYGKVTFLDGNLDYRLFPTTFDAKWQDFSHIGNMYLAINGFHTKNPSIGRFEVKIFPLDKLDE